MGESWLGRFVVLTMALALSACSTAGDTQDSANDSTVPASELASSPDDFVIAFEDSERPDGMVSAEVDFETRVVKVTSNKGEPDELAMWVEVPTTWSFDPGSGRFSKDAENWMEVVTTCDGPCEPKAWDVTLFLPGAFGQLARDEFVGSGTSGSSYDPALLGTAAQSAGDDSHSVTKIYQVDSASFASSFHYHYDASRIASCNISVVGVSVGVRGDYVKLCRQMFVDWVPLIEHSPAPQSPEIVVLPKVASLIAQAEAGDTLTSTEFTVEERLVPLDSGDDAPTVSMLVPGDGSLAVVSDSFTEIGLGQDLSVFSDLKVENQCGVRCGPTDWEAELNGFSGLLGRERARLAPDNDSPLSNGWLLSGWAIDRDEYRVFVMRWNHDGSQHFRCTAELDSEDERFVTDVTAMCLSAVPAWPN